MANFQLQGTMGNQQPDVRTIAVTAGAVSSIKEGQIVSIAAGVATKVANGGAVAAAQAKLGLALRDSSETAAADGTVEVAVSREGLKIRGKVNNAGNLTSANLFTSCTLDVDGNGDQTIDEDEATGDIMINHIYSDNDVEAVLPFKL